MTAEITQDEISQYLDEVWSFVRPGAHCILNRDAPLEELIPLICKMYASCILSNFLEYPQEEQKSHMRRMIEQRQEIIKKDIRDMSK